MRKVFLLLSACLTALPAAAARDFSGLYDCTGEDGHDGTETCVQN